MSNLIHTHNRITAAGRRPKRVIIRPGSRRALLYTGRLGLATLAIVVCMTLIAGQVLAGGGDGTTFRSLPSVQKQLSFNNLFTGAAEYAYPIEVPPGTGGMQPKITLAYNSLARWGVLGYGWQIAGLDPISRSTRWGAPKYNGSDTFVLSGEDLVYNATEGYYHTKHETFERIQNVNGTGAGSYWVVTDANGTQYRYGYNADSRIEAVGKGGQVRVWALDQVKDVNGNYMTISYSEDATNGDYYPDTMTYTYNDAGGIGAYRTVKFVWEVRTDVRTSYDEGAMVRIDQRLQAIEARIGGNLIRKHVIAYDGGYYGGKSILWQISICGSDGTSCLPKPTAFTYQTVTEPRIGGEQSWGNPGQRSYIREVTSSGHTYYDLIDMNGDGMPDAVLRDGTTGTYNYRVWLNTGSGFGAEQSWGNPGVKTYLREVTSGHTYFDLIDMNGDGLPDVVLREGGNYRVWLNTGSGFGAEQSWGNPGVNTYIREVTSGNTYLTLVDMNGDGLPDVVQRTCSACNYRVWLNTGSGFGAEQSWQITSGGPPYGNSYLREVTSAGHSSVDLVDMNGDGLVDLVVRDPNVSSNYNFRVWLNNGRGFESILVWGNPINSYIREVTAATNGQVYFDLADMNGDGLPDIVLRNGGSGNYNYRVWLGGPATGDNLLTTVTLMTGGSIVFGYDRASRFGNQRLPFPMWVVTSITTHTDYADRLGVSGTTTYSYGGGLWDGANKEFRGFENVTITDPVGNKTIVHYYQGDGNPAGDNDAWEGQVNYTLSGGPGLTESSNILVKTVYFYMNSDTAPYRHSSAPYFAPISQVDTSWYEGGTTPKMFRVNSMNYDSYGNVGYVYNQGDTAITSDSTETYFYYAYNTSAWVVNKLDHTITNGYNKDNAWVKFRESWNYYDGQALGAVTKGNLTKTEAWLSGGTNAINTFGYDAYGDITSKVDANNNTTSIAYDSTYRTYVASVTDAKGYVTSNCYYGFSGCTASNTSDKPYAALEKVTDPNSQVTTYTYDTYGRMRKVWRPGDSTASAATVETIYNDLPIFSSYKPVYVKTVAKDGTSDGLVSFTFLDGLGRIIQTKSEAQTANYWVTVDTYYNARGLVDRTSVPYNTNTTTPDVATRQAQSATGVWTISTYDPLGRTTQTTNPDGTSTSVSYYIASNPADPDFNNGGRLAQNTTDANNHTIRKSLDAYGNIQTVTEFYTGGEYRTHYYYNTGTGELVKISDAKGNIWTNTYDTLGRKTQSVDPDMGTWSYTYDANGNLKTQIDAKGQKLCFNYDSLNRVTEKRNYVSTICSDGTQLAVYTYDTRMIGSGSDIGRLTKVDAGGNVKRYWDYDARGRVSQEYVYVPGVGSWTTSYAYDSLDRLTSITYPGGSGGQAGEVVNNTYNAQGLPQTVAGTNTYLSSASYNAFGRLASQTFGNGVVTDYDYYDASGECDDGSGACLYYSYRLRGVKAYKGATNLMWLSPYKYDKVGNIKSVTDNVRSQYNKSFSYDDLNRLTLATWDSSYAVNQPYGYDASGNITNWQGTTWSYVGATHKRSSDGTWSYQYDANGNLTSKTYGSTTYNYGYNYDNQLVSVSGSTSQSNVYDHAGQRVKKVEGSVTTYYVNQYYAEETGNVAQGKAATQSSTLSHSCIPAANKAVDGNTSGNFYDCSTTHTNADAQAWWQVDLGKTYTLSSIDVWNRTDCCSGRLSNFYIFVSDQPFVSTDLNTTINQAGVSNYYTAGAAGAKTSVSVNRTGRYVRVQLSGTNYLSLAEVQVWGTNVIKYYYANGQPIALREGGALKFNNTDHLGSVSEVTDANGAQVTYVVYQPWGGAWNYQEFPKYASFTGKVRDQGATGFYYLGARFYDGGGRFITPDSIVQDPYDPQMLNRYAYVRDNPVRLTDPTGHLTDSHGNTWGGGTGSRNMSSSWLSAVTANGGTSKGMSWSSGSSGGSSNRSGGSSSSRSGSSGGSYFLDSKNQPVFFPGVSGGFSSASAALDPSSSERQQAEARWAVNHAAFQIHQAHPDLSFSFSPGGANGDTFGVNFGDSRGNTFKITYGPKGVGIGFGNGPASILVNTDGTIDSALGETSQSVAYDMLEKQDLRLQGTVGTIAKYLNGIALAINFAEGVSDAAQTGNGKGLLEMNPEFAGAWGIVAKTWGTAADLYFYNGANTFGRYIDSNGVYNYKDQSSGRWYQAY